MTAEPAVAPLSVVIADDHAPTRAGVRHALEADGCTVLADVANATAAIVAAEEHVPDVCLLDIHMPGNGIAAARELSRRLPGMPIVMLTASAEDEDLFEALRAGASGYLLKDMDPDRLAAALRGVLSGEAALPRSLALRVMEQFASTPPRKVLSRAPKAAKLTERESAVLELMAQGLSTEQIAGRLFVGQVTVRTHIANVLKKLKVSDRDAAVSLHRQP